MLKLTQDPAFWTDVIISVPGQKPATIKVQFAYKDADQLKEWFEGLGDKTNFEGLRDIVRDWKGVDTQFTVEALEQMLKALPAAAGAFFDCYRRELLESRVKN